MTLRGLGSESIVVKVGRPQHPSSFGRGGTTTFMMRAFYDLGDRGLAGRDIDRTNRVLGANYRLCECRCGGETAISHKTDVSKGWAEGSPYRFKRGHATPEKSSSPTVGTIIVFSPNSSWDGSLVCSRGKEVFVFGREKGRMGSPVLPRFSLTSTDEDVVGRLHESILAASVYRLTRKTKGNKQTYHRALSNSDAETDLLIVLLPLMGRRRRYRIREVFAHPIFLRYGDAL